MLWSSLWLEFSCVAYGFFFKAFISQVLSKFLSAPEILAIWLFVTHLGCSGSTLRVPCWGELSKAWFRKEFRNVAYNSTHQRAIQEEQSSGVKNLKPVVELLLQLELSMLSWAETPKHFCTRGSSQQHKLHLPASELARNAHSDWGSIQLNLLLIKDVGSVDTYLYLFLNLQLANKYHIRVIIFTFQHKSFKGTWSDSETTNWEFMFS